MAEASRSLAVRCGAEILGTYVLVFFGLGAVHVGVLTGDLSGLWQIAIIWAVAIMLAIYLVGAISGAHINPAITVALAAHNRFPWRDVLPYVLAQFVGAFMASATLFALFQGPLAQKEAEKGVQRGQPGSVVTAMCYGEFFPSPGPLAAGGADKPYSEEQHRALNSRVGEPTACLAEFLGTMLLALMVFALTDQRNGGAPPSNLAGVFIGLTVAALIVVIAPLTQACFNPARDAGPRLFAALAGWGRAAFPDGSGFFTVYLLAPTLGAVTGGALYDHLIRPALTVPTEE